MIKLNGKEFNIDKFPDGTLLLKYAVPQMDYMTSLRATITWYFESNEEMITIMYLTRHLQNHGVKYVDLVMPYIPNARQDRVKKSEDVFTLKYFAEFINNLVFNSVTVLDPHSSVSEALIDNLKIVNPERYIRITLERIKKNDDDKPLIAFYPDEGAMKRYSELINIPYAFGIKRRDWETGKIQGLDVAGSTELIKDSNILIIDDISSKGGTFYYSAKKLKELGAANIYLYITHCENTILQGEVLTSGLIEKVFTTNSIFTQEHEKIEVMKL